MDKAVIESKVCEIINKYAQFNNKEGIQLDCDLRDNYGIDSILIVDILVEIENTFNIMIDGNLLTYDSFSTAQKILDYLNKELVK